MAPMIAYIAQGKLFVKKGDRSPTPVESPFANGILERAARDQQRHSWKQRGAGAGPRANFLWNLGGGQAIDPSARKINFGGVTLSGEGHLLYTLETDLTCGLFIYDHSTGEEKRLVHRKDFRAIDLARHEADGTIACSITKPDGTAHLGLMDEQGGRLREVTEGDAVDQAPSWVAGAKQTLIYQSAGVARTPQGFAYAIGPYAILKLDLVKGELTTILEDPRIDYLLPRMLPDETVYFIRRPYEPIHGVSPFQTLKDVALFPVRMLLAIFGFLNFFSIIFAQQPLTHAGGPKMPEVDGRFMMLYGKIIDADKAIKGKAAEEGASLVPDKWELVKSSKEGKSTVLAKGVLAYDLSPDGQIVYTNGSAVFRIGPDGKSERICTGRLIERVVAL